MFFFLGTLGLFTGLSVWVISGINDDLYFGRMHAHYMIGIFLLSFIIGFLMTAIPRMSMQAPASKKEMLLQLIPMLSAAFWGLFEEQEQYFFLSLIVAILILFRFAGRRILKSPHMIPDVFPMVLISLISGVSGAMLCFMGHTDIGGRLFYLNFVLGLCVGIGARLIPMILQLNCGYNSKRGEFWIIGLLLLGACFIEVYLHESSGNFLRALVIGFVFFRHWKVHKFGGPNSSVAWGMRLSAVSMLAGVFALWLFPVYRLEALHLLYVSGFSVLTLMVASRVILAHGNHDLSLEFKNWFIKVPILLFLLAAATRVSAVFIPGGYERHLAYAAISFLAGCILWAYFFMPKLLDLGLESEELECEATDSLRKTASP